MIQVFIFHGYDVDGQRACRKASAKVNHFLQSHQEITSPHVSTNYTASYSAHFSSSACECVVTVVAQVGEPIVLTEEDYCEEDEPQKWIDVS